MGCFPTQPFGLEKNHAPESIKITLRLTEIVAAVCDRRYNPRSTMVSCEKPGYGILTLRRANIFTII